MIICDTNILIELYKGNTEIISSLRKIEEKNICVSDIIVAEIFYGARDRKDLNFLEKQLRNIKCFSINEAISSLAVKLVQKYSLSHKLSLADSLIAATAICHDFELFTLNEKDFRFIEHLRLYQVGT